MKISIIYKERYEMTCKLLMEELSVNCGYEILTLSDVMRYNLTNETEIGQVAKAKMEDGEVVPDEIFHKMITTEIEKVNSQKLAIKGYPNSKMQISLFKEYCKNENFQIEVIWYMKGVNTLRNLRNNEKHNLILQKWNSEEIMERNVFGPRKRIEQSLNDFNMPEIVKIFESEAVGVEYKNDKQRIKETIHNKLSPRS